MAPCASREGIQRAPHRGTTCTGASSKTGVRESMHQNPHHEDHLNILRRKDRDSHYCAVNYALAQGKRQLTVPPPSATLSCTAGLWALRSSLPWSRQPPGGPRPTGTPLVTRGEHMAASHALNPAPQVHSIRVALRSPSTQHQRTIQSLLSKDKVFLCFLSK